MRLDSLAPHGALLSLFLAASLTAQSGTYSPFGQGCPGTGTGSGPGCLSENWNQPFGGNTGLTGYFATLANTGATTRLICGFQLYCKTASNQPAQMNVWIYDRAASGKPGQPLRSSTMAVGGTAAAYTAMIAPPLILAPNTDFYIVYDNSVRLNLPIVTSGTIGTHCWNGPNWSGPAMSWRWNYNVLCCGAGATPQLTATGVPTIAQSFQVHLDSARASTAALLVLGVSNTQWGAFQLPLDLTPLGAGGCSLLASLDLAVANPVDASGMSTLPIPIANDARLVGVPFHNQWLVVDPPANSFGIVTSNAATGRIGR